MLPLANHCHTNCHNPFHYVLFKLKDLVAKQQATVNAHNYDSCTLVGQTGNIISYGEDSSESNISRGLLSLSDV